MKKETLELAMSAIINNYDNCQYYSGNMANEAIDELDQAIKDKSIQEKYYDVGGLDTFHVIKTKLTEEQYEGFLLGNILKYGCRLNYKHSNRAKDSAKLIDYAVLLHMQLKGLNSITEALEGLYINER